LLTKNNSFTYTREKAETIITAALEHLEILMDSIAKDTLHGIGMYVLNRDK